MGIHRWLVLYGVEREYQTPNLGRDVPRPHVSFSDVALFVFEVSSFTVPSTHVDAQRQFSVKVLLYELIDSISTFESVAQRCVEFEIRGYLVVLTITVRVVLRLSELISVAFHAVG